MNQKKRKKISISKNLDKIFLRTIYDSEDISKINKEIDKVLFTFNIIDEDNYISAKTKHGETIYGSPVIGYWGRFINNIEKHSNNAAIIKGSIESQA